MGCARESQQCLPTSPGCPWLLLRPLSLLVGFLSPLIAPADHVQEIRGLSLLWTRVTPIPAGLSPWELVFGLGWPGDL